MGVDLSIAGVIPPKMKLAAKIMAGILGVGIAYNMVTFDVAPNERAGVRRFGAVVSTEPVQPGRYFQVPFFTTVDELTVSLQTVHVKPFTVNTVDNQRVSLEINISYSVPDAAVFHLLYNVGRNISGDITANIEPIVRDRVSRVFANKNTNFISRDRDQIQDEVTAVVHDELSRMFRVQINSVQIASINFSDAFISSNENAVQEKNRAVAAENKVKTIGLEAQQRVAEAEGAAKTKIAQAEGANKSAILAAEAEAKRVELSSNADARARVIQARAEAEATLAQAEADKKARELRGSGEAAALTAIVGSMGGAERYIQMLNAQANNRWKGEVPTTVLNGGDKGVTMPMIVPMPSATAATRG